jgi:hypothetical protein
VPQTSSVYGTGEEPVDEFGLWSASWTSPAAIVPGEYQILANCGGTDPWQPGLFTIVGDVPPIEPIEPIGDPVEPIEVAPQFTG